MAFNLEDHRVVNAPPNLYYIPDYITETEEKRLMSLVYGAPLVRWKNLKNRRLQNWGGLPQPKGLLQEPLPEWLQECGSQIRSLGVFGGHQPNHVLVNEYKPGQGIMPHLDGPLYYPTVATVSLGGHAVLEFYKYHSEGDMAQGPETPATAEEFGDRFCLYVAPRSLVVQTDSLYKTYLHGIEEKIDDWLPPSHVLNSQSLPFGAEQGMQCPRATRVSITVRYVPRVIDPAIQRALLAGLRKPVKT